MSQRQARRVVPRAIAGYVMAVSVIALALLPLTRQADGALHGIDAFIAAGVLVPLIVAAQWNTVQIGARRRMHIGTTTEVATVLLLPGPLAVMSVTLSTMAGESRTRGPFIQRQFNASVAVVKASAAALVLAAGRDLLPEPVGAPIAMAGAALAMYLVTTLLVTGVAAIQLRENPLRRAWTAQRDLFITEATLSATGILAALATEQQAWALPLLVAPALIAQRALRDGVALQAQTRLALEELADIVDMRDHYTYEHSRRVAELARATARKMGLGAETVELVTMAGRVHDVGKIGIKSTVLMKPGKLTDAEWNEMRSHPVVGARLIARFPQFAHGRDLVLHHHERFDGKGYPNGLAGESIPIGARVLAVADAWDAMTSHRAYRRALDIEHVRAEIACCSGTQFDPAVARAFLDVLDERPDLATPAPHLPQEADVAPDANAQATRFVA